MEFPSGKAQIIFSKSRFTIGFQKTTPPRQTTQSSSGWGWNLPKQLHLYQCMAWIEPRLAQGSPPKLDGYEEAHERTISLHGTSSPKPCQHRKQNRLSVIPAIVIPSQPGRKTPYILWWLQPQTLMMAKSLLEYITKIPVSLYIYIHIIYIYIYAYCK